MLHSNNDWNGNCQSCCIVGIFLIFFEEEVVKMDPTVGFYGSFPLFEF